MLNHLIVEKSGVFFVTAQKDSFSIRSDKTVENADRLISAYASFSGMASGSIHLAKSQKMDDFIIPGYSIHVSSDREGFLGIITNARSKVQHYFSIQAKNVDEALSATRSIFYEIFDGSVIARFAFKDNSVLEAVSESITFSPVFTKFNVQGSGKADFFKNMFESYAVENRTRQLNYFAAFTDPVETPLSVPLRRSASHKVQAGGIARVVEHLNNAVEGKGSVVIFTSYQKQGKGSTIDTEKNLKEYRDLGNMLNNLKNGAISLAGIWKGAAENSYLVPNLSLDLAKKLNAKYHQWAFIYAGPDSNGEFQMWATPDNNAGPEAYVVANTWNNYAVEGLKEPMGYSQLPGTDKKFSFYTGKDDPQEYMKALDELNKFANNVATAEVSFKDVKRPERIREKNTKLREMIAARDKNLDNRMISDADRPKTSPAFYKIWKWGVSQNKPEVLFDKISRKKWQDYIKEKGLNFVPEDSPTALVSGHFNDKEGNAFLIGYPDQEYPFEASSSSSSKETRIYAVNFDQMSPDDFIEFIDKTYLYAWSVLDKENLYHRILSFDTIISEKLEVPINYSQGMSIMSKRPDVVFFTFDTLFIGKKVVNSFEPEEKHNAFANKAFWLTPGGRAIDVKINHIDAVIKDPGTYGYTSEEIKDIFKEFNEPMGLEGQAREKIMSDLLNKGWTRLRWRPKEYSWTAQVGSLNYTIMDNLQSWASGMLKADSSYSTTDITIVPVSSGVPISHSLPEIANDVLYKTSAMENKMKKTNASAGVPFRKGMLIEKGDYITFYGYKCIAVKDIDPNGYNIDVVAASGIPKDVVTLYLTTFDGKDENEGIRIFSKKNHIIEASVEIDQIRKMIEKPGMLTPENREYILGYAVRLGTDAASSGKKGPESDKELTALVEAVGGEKKLSEAIRGAWKSGYSLINTPVGSPDDVLSFNFYGNDRYKRSGKHELVELPSWEAAKSYAEYLAKTWQIDVFYSLQDDPKNKEWVYFSDLRTTASVWTKEQNEAYTALNDEFQLFLAEKGIEPGSKESSDAWRSAGFQDRVKKLFANPSDLFIGHVPTGIAYADRRKEVNGDYKKIANLFYATLELKIYDEKSDLLPLVKEDAAKIQAMKGQSYQTTTSGQSVILGYDLPEVKNGLVNKKTTAAMYPNAVEDAFIAKLKVDLPEIYEEVKKAVSSNRAIDNIHFAEKPVTDTLVSAILLDGYKIKNLDSYLSADSVAKVTAYIEKTLPELLKSDAKKKTTSAKMPSFKVTFENGDSLVTSMASGVTLEDAKKYYIGKPFTFGTGEKDTPERQVKAVSVEPVESGFDKNASAKYSARDLILTDLDAVMKEKEDSDGIYPTNRVTSDGADEYAEEAVFAGIPVKIFYSIPDTEYSRLAESSSDSDYIPFATRAEVDLVECDKKGITDAQIYTVLKKFGQASVTASAGVSTADLEDMIKRFNEAGSTFYLGEAYGAYELWAKNSDGKDVRIESGSRADIKKALIQNRFNEKYRVKASNKVQALGPASERPLSSLNLEKFQKRGKWGLRYIGSKEVWIDPIYTWIDDVYNASSGMVRVHDKNGDSLAIEILDDSGEYDDDTVTASKRTVASADSIGNALLKFVSFSKEGALYKTSFGIKTLTGLGAVATRLVEENSDDAALGNAFAAFACLKLRKEDGRYATSWGTKTPQGLGASLRRIVEESVTTAAGGDWDIGDGDDTNPYIESDIRLLERLKQDCDYYLGNGGRHPKHLWAGDASKQIAKMREVFEGLPADSKPEWLSMEDIDDYARQMGVVATPKVKAAGRRTKAVEGFMPYTIDGVEYEIEYNGEVYSGGDERAPQEKLDVIKPSEVSDEKWDEIWEDVQEAVVKHIYSNSTKAVDKSDADIAAEFDGFEIRKVSINGDLKDRDHLSGVIEIFLPVKDFDLGENWIFYNFGEWVKDPMIVPEFGYDHWYPQNVIDAFEEAITEFVSKQLGISTTASRSVNQVAIDSYKEALLWADEEKLLEDYPDLDLNIHTSFSEEANKAIEADVTKFFTDNAADIEAFKEAEQTDDAQVAHSFLLTRQGHGAGFIDFNSDAAKALYEASKRYPELSVYAGEDGLIYFEGFETTSAKLDKFGKVPAGVKIEDGEKVTVYFDGTDRTAMDYADRVKKDLGDGVFIVNKPKAFFSTASIALIPAEMTLVDSEGGYDYYAGSDTDGTMVYNVMSQGDPTPAGGYYSSDYISSQKKAPNLFKELGDSPTSDPRM